MRAIVSILTGLLLCSTVASALDTLSSGTLDNSPGGQVLNVWTNVLEELPRE